MDKRSDGKSRGQRQGGRLDLQVPAVITGLWKAAREGIEKYWGIIQYTSLGISLLLIGLSLYANWRELSDLEWDVDYMWFTASLLLVSMAVLTLAVWWTWSIRILNGQLSWRRGIKMWAFAQLAKYLPGGIWNYASRIYACDRAGIPKTRTTLTLAVETILRIQAAGIVFLASLPLWPENEWRGESFLLVIGVLLLGFLVVTPHILIRGPNLIMRALGRPKAKMTVLKYRQILALLAGHIFTVAVSGGAFYLMVISIYAVPFQAALPMAGMLAISVISGFLNPLTPHGLGTREGLLIILLHQYLPFSVAIVISLLSRLWLTLSELVGVLITILFSALGSIQADL